MSVSDNSFCIGLVHGYMARISNGVHGL